MRAILIYLLLINGLAFLTNGIDKRLAIAQKSRVSEKTLLLLAFLGGSIGGGMAMLVFRHKTAKLKYLLSFFGIVVVQGIGLYFYLKS